MPKVTNFPFYMDKNRTSLGAYEKIGKLDPAPSSGNQFAIFHTLAFFYHF